jgi:transcriptional regulator GlxA family with amidase domain
MIVNEGQIFDILSSLPNYIEISNTSEILDIFSSLGKYYNTGVSENDLMLQSLVMRLVYSLSRYTPLRNISHIAKKNNSKVIENTLEYLKQNLAVPLSLETLAERANFSPIYFHKLFKASTGKTLREYIEEERIKKSVELLVSTDMTLTEIAYECGFSSQSYFSYAFKKKMMLPPREYVKIALMKYENTEEHLF